MNSELIELHYSKLGEWARVGVCGFSNFSSIKFGLFSRILNWVLGKKNPDIFRNLPPHDGGL